jgi:hypothetical protein
VVTPESVGPADGDLIEPPSAGPTQSAAGEGTTAATKFVPSPDYPRRTFYTGRDGPTEFSWGPGQVPVGFERKSPAEGGAYRGRSPRTDAHGRLPKVRRGQAYGVPGERLR